MQWWPWNHIPLPARVLLDMDVSMVTDLGDDASLLALKASCGAHVNIHSNGFIYPQENTGSRQVLTLVVFGNFPSQQPMRQEKEAVTS